MGCRRTVGFGGVSSEIGAMTMIMRGYKSSPVMLG